MFVVLLAIALIPGLFWLFLLAWLGRREPGFRATLLKIFVLGMAICIPAGLFNTSLQLSLFGHEPEDSLQRFLLFMIVVGPVEEGLKFLILYSEVYRRWQVRTPRDGVLLSTASAIGFATYENAHYAEMFGVEVLAVRGWACVMAHVGFSAVFGHYLGLAKTRRFSERACLVEGLALSAALHGLYDFWIDGGELVLYAFLAGLTVLYAVLRGFALRPLSVMLFPALTRAALPEAGRAAVEADEFPEACGAERGRADAVLLKLDADDERERLDGLLQARGLSDRKLQRKVRALRHDPVEDVRRLAAEIAGEMKNRLKRGG